MLRPLSGPCILLATAPTTPLCFCRRQRSSSLHIQRKKFLYLHLSWPAGHSKRVFTNKAQTARCIGINSFEEKVIDKSHKKRYILFINALKKSAHCICRSESRSFAANPVRSGGVLSLWSRSGELKGKLLPELPYVTGASRGAGCPAQFGWYRGM